MLQLVELSKRAARGDALARRQALELSEALQVLSSFDEGCDLVLYYKYLLVLNGDREYALHFNETDALSARAPLCRESVCAVPPVVRAVVGRATPGLILPFMTGRAPAASVHQLHQEIP